LDLAKKKGQSKVVAYLGAKTSRASVGQFFSFRQWQLWLLGGGTAQVGQEPKVVVVVFVVVMIILSICVWQASKWPFFMVTGTSIFCSLLFFRIFSPTGQRALAGHE